jgi:hypothetical protein
MRDRRTPVARIRQSDITRALRAAQAAGLKVAGYQLDAATGRIIVTIWKDGATQELVAPLDRWLAEHADDA